MMFEFYEPELAEFPGNHPLILGSEHFSKYWSAVIRLSAQSISFNNGTDLI